MQRQIQQSFQSGTFTPQTHLIELKHIGPYLYDRLRKTFAPNLQSLSFRRFARSIENLQLSTVKKKLQTAVQNRRNNQCIQTNSDVSHHVRDFNEKGYEALISLIKVMSRNNDGYNLGVRFVFDAAQLRMPRRRDDSTKTLPCLSRVRCGPRGGRFHNGLCLPPTNATGFSGVFPRSGQKTYNRNNNYELGSSKNSVRRGNYVNDPNSRTLWRKPGRMRKCR